MPKPENIKRKLIQVRYAKTGVRGSALVETAAGLFILLPVFLLLIDIVALVIAQSVNDDLANQAARYAGEYTPYNVSFGVMNTAASTNATNYLEQYCTSYVNTTTGIVCNAQVVGQCNCTWNAVSGWQVQAITQVTCNLPIPVPFGGPSSTTFQAQSTKPIVDIQPGQIPGST